MENYQAAPLHGLCVWCLLPARAGALRTLQHRWGRGARGTCQHVWGCPEQPCHGEPPAATRAGPQGPKLAAVDVPGNWHGWAPSHCGTASTRQTSCASRMSAQPARVTFPICDEAAGNPRQPHMGPGPSPAVTCMQKVQRAQSWARAAPASLGTVPCQHSPPEDTLLPAHGCLSSSAGTAAPARAAQRVTRRN